MQKILRLVIVPGMFVFLSLACYSQGTQTVCFSYDDNGNRIIRSTCTLKIAEVDSTDSLSIISNAKSGADSNDVAFKEMFSVFPNPTNGELNIRTNGNYSDIHYTISLFTINGQEILQQKSGKPANVVDMSVYIQGTYILVVGSDTRQAKWKVIRIE